MKIVVSHQPLIQRALSNYDARREFVERERSLRVTWGERRAALASLVLSKQNDVFKQGKRFSRDEMEGPNQWNKNS